MEDKSQFPYGRLKGFDQLPSEVRAYAISFPELWEAALMVPIEMLNLTSEAAQENEQAANNFLEKARSLLDKDSQCVLIDKTKNIRWVLARPSSWGQRAVDEEALMNSLDEDPDINLKKLIDLPYNPFRVPSEVLPPKTFLVLQTEDSNLPIFDEVHSHLVAYAYTSDHKLIKIEMNKSEREIPPDPDTSIEEQVSKGAVPIPPSFSPFAPLLQRKQVPTKEIMVLTRTMNNLQRANNPLLT